MNSPYKGQRCWAFRAEKRQRSSFQLVRFLKGSDKCRPTERGIGSHLSFNLEDLLLKPETYQTENKRVKTLQLYEQSCSRLGAYRCTFFKGDVITYLRKINDQLNLTKRIQMSKRSCNFPPPTTSKITQWYTLFIGLNGLNYDNTKSHFFLLESSEN